MPLDFAWDTFWKCLTTFLYPPKDFGLRDNSETSWQSFNGIQPNLGWDKIWKYIRIISIGCQWVLPKTHFGKALQHFWYIAIEIWLGDSLIKF